MSMLHTVCERWRRGVSPPTVSAPAAPAATGRSGGDVAGLTCARAMLPKHEGDPESPGCWAHPPRGSDSAGLGWQLRLCRWPGPHFETCCARRSPPRARVGAMSSGSRRTGWGGGKHAWAQGRGRSRHAWSCPDSGDRSQPCPHGSHSVLRPEPAAPGRCPRPRGLALGRCLHPSTPAPVFLTATAWIHGSSYRWTDRSSGREWQRLPNPNPELPSQTSLA